MSRQRSLLRRRTLGLAIALLPGLASLPGCGKSAPQPPEPPSPTPATAPSPAAAASPADEPGPPTQYGQVIRRHYPDFPTTQPLDTPLDLTASAHLILPEPIYCCPMGHLWITCPDAAPLAPKRLAGMIDDQIHIVPQTVLYVHWGQDDSGHVTPTLIVADDPRGDLREGHPAADLSAGAPTADAGPAGARMSGGNTPAAPGRVGGPRIIDASKRLLTLPPRRYHWDLAVSWADRIIVPADAGISVITLKPDFREDYHDLLDDADRAAVRAGAKHFPAARFVFDSHPAVLAWIPCDDAATGGGKTARFVDGAWVDLPPESWPTRIQHMVPFLDGSVLQLIHQPDDTISLAVAVLEKTPVDENHVADLVNQLSDDDETVRDKANDELSRYGPGVWPILEKLRDSQPPEGQDRIRDILRDEIAPTLGAGLTAPGGRMRLVARNNLEGGALFFADALAVPVPGKDEPHIVQNAYLQFSPGRAVMVLPPHMMEDVDPAHSSITACGDDIIAADDIRGLRWFDGGKFVPLLRPGEAAFSHVLARDVRGRWLLRQQSPDDESGYLPTTAPTAAISTLSQAPTLIIDPTLPDPTPHLPIWTIQTAKQAGWDDNNWPAIKAGGAWALQQSDWAPVDDKQDHFHTDVNDPSAPPHAPQLQPPAPSAPPGTNSTTAPATGSAAASETTGGTGTTAPTGNMAGSISPDLGPLLLTAPDGTRYYDGRQTLTTLSPGGDKTVWPLPGNAVGDGDVTLIRSAEGKLFLFNAPGRIVRIGPSTPAASAAPASALDRPEPFKLEAIFSHKVPSDPHPARIWLDPAGRIDIAYGANHLAILFPTGQPPEDLEEKIPAGAVEDGAGQ